jgi:hypothetical protein
MWKLLFCFALLAASAHVSGRPVSAVVVAEREDYRTVYFGDDDGSGNDDAALLCFSGYVCKEARILEKDKKTYADTAFYCAELCTVVPFCLLSFVTPIDLACMLVFENKDNNLIFY